MVFNRFLKMLSQIPVTKPNQPQAATPQPPTPTAPVMAKPLVLPHPEEPQNPAATLATCNKTAVLNQWLADWGVPSQYWDHWKQTIEIEVYDSYPSSILAMGMKQDTPAATWEAGGKRHLAIKPAWLNPGVIAHEQAHNSYAYLNAEQKAAFAALFGSLKNTNPMMKLLFSKNTYGLSNDVEGHAEVYRYIGQAMPAELKQFYPALF